MSWLVQRSTEQQEVSLERQGMASSGHQRVAAALGTTKDIAGIPSREVTRPDSTDDDDTWDGSEQGDRTLS